MVLIRFERVVLACVAAIAIAAAGESAEAAVLIDGRVEGTRVDAPIPCPAPLTSCGVSIPVAFNVQVLLDDSEIVDGFFSFSRFGGPLRDFRVAGTVTDIGSGLLGRDLQFSAQTNAANPFAFIRASASAFPRRV